MQMVKEAKQGHRLWSVQGMVATVVLLGAEILPLWESVLPENTFLILSLVSASASIVLRFIQQQGLSDE